MTKKFAHISLKNALHDWLILKCLVCVTQMLAFERIPRTHRYPSFLHV